MYNSTLSSIQRANAMSQSPRRCDRRAEPRISTEPYHLLSRFDSAPKSPRARFTSTKGGKAIKRFPTRISKEDGVKCVQHGVVRCRTRSYTPTLLNREKKTIVLSAKPECWVRLRRDNVTVPASGIEMRRNLPTNTLRQARKRKRDSCDSFSCPCWTSIQP